MVKKSERKDISSLKPVEEISDEVVKPMYYLSYFFLIGGIAAIIAWMVFVAKWNIDYYDKRTLMVIPDGDSEAAALENDAIKARDLAQQADICFQAAVASLLLYFALKHHLK